MPLAEVILAPPSEDEVQTTTRDRRHVPITAVQIYSQEEVEAEEEEDFFAVDDDSDGGERGNDLDRDHPHHLSGLSSGKGYAESVTSLDTTYADSVFGRYSSSSNNDASALSSLSISSSAYYYHQYSYDPLDGPPGGCGGSGSGSGSSSSSSSSSNSRRCCWTDRESMPSTASTNHTAARHYPSSHGIIVAIEEDSLSSTEGGSTTTVTEQGHDQEAHRHPHPHPYRISINSMVEAAASDVNNARQSQRSQPPRVASCNERVPSSLDIIVATEEDTDDYGHEAGRSAQEAHETQASESGDEDGDGGDDDVPGGEHHPIDDGKSLARTRIHESSGSLATAGAVIADDDTIGRESVGSTSECTAVAAGGGGGGGGGGGFGQRTAGDVVGNDSSLLSVPASTTELRSVPSSRDRPMPRRSSLKRQSSYGTPDWTSPVDFERRGAIKVLPKPDVERLQQEQIRRTLSMKSSVSMPELPSEATVSSSNFQRSQSVGEDGMSSSRRVAFDKIIIREHRRTMGDNPSCSYGTPITLDWEYIQHEVLTLDQYEHLKLNSRIWSGGKPRTLRQMHLNHYQRRNLLQLEGYSLEQIKAQKRETNKARKQRDMTRFIAQTPVLIKIEDIVESSKRRLFGRKNNGGDKNSKQKQHQLPTVIPPAPFQAPITVKKPAVTSTTSATLSKSDELNDSNGTQTTVATTISSL